MSVEAIYYSIQFFLLIHHILCLRTCVVVSEKIFHIKIVHRFGKIQFKKRIRTESYFRLCCSKTVSGSTRKNVGYSKRFRLCNAANIQNLISIFRMNLLVSTAKHDF